MMKNIKKENGVTLAVLVIIVIVLVIISAAVVNISKSSIMESKKSAFTEELEMIRGKLSVINKEIALGSTAYDNIGVRLEDLSASEQLKIQNILLQNEEDDYSNYRYLTSQELSDLGLKNIEQDVIISYVKEKVFSYTGIRVNGRLYYSIDQIDQLTD